MVILDFFFPPYDVHYLGLFSLKKTIFYTFHVLSLPLFSGQVASICQNEKNGYIQKRATKLNG